MPQWGCALTTFLLANQQQWELQGMGWVTQLANRFGWHMPSLVEDIMVAMWSTTEKLSPTPTVVWNGGAPVLGTVDTLLRMGHGVPTVYNNRDNRDKPEVVRNYGCCECVAFNWVSMVEFPNCGLSSGGFFFYFTGPMYQHAKSSSQMVRSGTQPPPV